MEKTAEGITIIEEQRSRKRKEFDAEDEPAESKKTRSSLVDEFKIEEMDAETFYEVLDWLDQVLAADMSLIKVDGGDDGAPFSSEFYYDYSSAGPTFVSTSGDGKEEETCGACFSDWRSTVMANLDVGQRSHGYGRETKVNLCMK
ncbi:uncharacterized protein A4U43_C08F4820 [Asparagus officinalis]|nr:uncharacterized protein A4U43_C08F4820 [Asparagus officinalis]